MTTSNHLKGKEKIDGPSDETIGLKLSNWARQARRMFLSAEVVS